ncbi:ankyrin repeat domain-containing protein [Rickettsia helvetica]|uniref:ANK-REP-REGION domain-containing protein n=1 Tax=Rickettsia helvetica TaxID=35789 RepID=A0ABM9NCX8_RICHE|nr:ankyrin repeat domain-containing protein [Rickettsia helvetica]MCZ6883769.1 hypothetical protein [Rickettsia endosymbiont of Ixodes ricinus]MCZ6896315.1 hypothetical protein [Rickettsia endosymbiont of Ixodes ricinus]
MSNQTISIINNNNGETALTYAAWKGLKSVYEILIFRISDQAINHINNNDDIALIWSAYNGWKKICEQLISKMNKKTISVIDNDGYSALIYANNKG